MKRSPVVNDHLQMPSMYISPGSTMFSAKKSKLKDGSFFPILLQSETMFLSLGHFLGSRRTLENLFVRFERTLNGVVFDENILRAITVHLQESASNIHKIRLFSRRVLGDVVWRTSCESWNRQPWKSRHYKWVKSTLFVIFRRCVWLITDFFVIFDAKSQKS